MTEWFTPPKVSGFTPAAAKQVTQDDQPVSKRKKKKAGMAQFLPMFGVMGEQLGVAGQTLGDL